MKRKTLKRFAVLAVVLVTALALAACAGSTPAASSPPASTPPASSAPPASTPPESSAPPASTPPASAPPASSAPPAQPGAVTWPANPEHYKVGLMAYINAGAWFQTINDAVTVIASKLNCEITTAAAGNPDESIAAVENLCAAGCNGIVCLATAGVSSKLIDICQKNNVYLVACYNDISGDDGYAATSTNPFYAGGIYANEHDTGYQIMKAMIDAGATQTAVFGLPPGVSTSFDQRIGGAEDAIKDANLQVLTEARSFDMAGATQNLLSQYPNLNGIFSSVTSTVYLSQPLVAAGLAGKVQVNTYDEGPDGLAGFQNGTVTIATDGANAEAQFAFCMLYNAMSGNRMADGSGAAQNILMPYAIIKSAADYQVFIDNSTNGKAPYTADELAQFITVTNPSANAADMAKAAGNFSLTDITARHPS